MASVLERWQARDRSAALGHDDLRAIDSSEGARSNVLERWGDSNDFLHAAATYGAALAAAGASASLAAVTLDHLAELLGTTGAPVTIARAAMLEGFTRELLDVARRRLLAAWSAERCVVLLGGERAAVVCGFPSDDAEEVTAWAESVARRLARLRVRRVLTDRPPPEALIVALDVAGIAVERSLV